MMDGVLDRISSFIFHVLTKIYDRVELSCQLQVGPLLLSRLVKVGSMILVLWLVSFVYFSIYFFFWSKKKTEFCFYWKKKQIVLYCEKKKLIWKKIIYLVKKYFLEKRNHNISELAADWPKRNLEDFRQVLLLVSINRRLIHLSKNSEFTCSFILTSSLRNFQQDFIWFFSNQIFFNY